MLDHTGPGVLHQGFNSGENIAEAINFAIPEWLPLLPNLLPCTCNPESVILDVKQIMLNGLNHLKKIR